VSPAAPIDFESTTVAILADDARLVGDLTVPPIPHLFGEPGALEQVAELARHWFVRHLQPSTDS
jgi:hypothetical protein